MPNDIQSPIFVENAESLQAADAESGENPKQKRSLKAKLKSMFESSKPAATATNFQVWIMVIILQNVLISEAYNNLYNMPMIDIIYYDSVVRPLDKFCDKLIGENPLLPSCPRVFPTACLYGSGKTS